MPRHRRADIAEALRREYDVDPPGVFEQIDGTIVPVQLVDTLSRATANRPAVSGNAVGASVGNYSVIQLWNPNDSNVDLHLRQFAIWTPGGATTVYWRYYDSAVGTLTARIWADRRLSGTPFGRLNGEQRASAVGTIFATLYTGAAGVLYPFPIILGPGQGVLWIPSAQNIALNVMCDWLEEPVVP